MSLFRSASLIIWIFLLTEIPLSGQQTGKSNPKENGYSNTDEMGGPKSIGRQLEQDNNKYLFEYRFPIKHFKPWYDMKSRLNEKTGIQFGINYTSVYINSTATITDQNRSSAASGILDIQAGWNLVGRKSGKNKGTLFIKFNSRHVYGGSGNTSPMFHGLFESGYYGLPATAFRHYTFRIVELNWQQSLLDNHISFSIGKVDITNYFNFHGLIVPWQHFLGYGSSVSGTVNWSNVGLGGVLSVRPTDNLYLMGGMVDVYGDLFEDGDFFDLGRNWQNGDFMYILEGGYVPSFAERYFKKISFTYWNSSPYTSAGGSSIGSGSGVAFTSHWFFRERFAPYLRLGFSNGVGENAFYKKDIQIGHGLRFGNYDMLGTAISWNETNIPDSKDQFTGEVFYRFNLSAHLELTPSMQIIVNPTFNPSQSTLIYLGIRGRITL
jgi:porin